MRNILKINDSTTVTRVKEGSFRYVQQVGEEGVGIRFGTIFSSYIEAEAFYMTGLVTEVNEGDVLYYYQTREVDEDFVPLGYEQQFLIGIFTVEKCVRGKDTYSFIAYDNIHKLNVDFSAKLLSMKSSFPMSMQDFCDEFESFVSGLGVTIYMSNYWAYSMTEPNQIEYFYANGITALDILSYLCALTLQQAVCYTSGQIGFRRYMTDAYEQTYLWKNSDQYIIAPTDTVTYTGQYIDPDTGLPVTGTLTPVFYKENGLSREGYSLANIDGWYVYDVDGTNIYGIEFEHPSVNAYNITDNIIASKITMDDHDAGWDEIADYGVLQLYQYLLRDFAITPFEVHLFPFRCPFMAGQILPHIIDANGNQFQSVIMKMEWTDSEVILTCVSPETYYQTSSHNYDADDVTTSLSVEVNDLKDGKVSKTGDTMTGSLSVKNTDYAVTETPSSNSYRYVQFKDKNDTIFAQVSGAQLSNTDVGLRLAARRTVNGSELVNYLMILVDSNRQPKVSINFPEAWRTALNIGTNGVLPITIAQGGTGATDAETAISNLGLGNLKASSSSISNGSSKDFSLPNSSRGVIISSGSSNNTKGMYLYNVTSVGAVSTVPVLSASGITLTTATNKVTIANSGGSQTVVCILSY